MRKGLRILAVGLTLALPAAAARAESVSYVEGGNVFIATSDGARRVPITSAGTTDSPYVLAGHADSGKTVTSYGPSYSKTWFIFNPDGTNSSEGPNLVPMRSCGGALGSIGPISPRLHPDGDLVAFNYSCNGPPPGYSITLYLAVDLPKYYTAGSNSQPISSDLFQASFFGKRLVVEAGGLIQVQEDHPDDPFRTTFMDWIQGDAGESLTRAEVARSGGRVVLDYRLNNVPKVAIGTFTMTPPGDFTGACTLDAATGDPSDATFSPDGNKLAWTDSGGVKVGQVDLALPGCIVPGSVKTLSATGSDPRFSNYTIPAPVQTPPAGGGGQPQTPGGGGATTQTPATVTPALSVALPANAKLAQLVKGLVVSFNVNGPGVIEAALMMPAKQAKKLGVARVAAAQVRLGFARKTVTAAGKGKLTLKLTKKAKKRAKRLKGRTLTLQTTFKPGAGTPVVAVKKLRIR